MQKVNPNFEPMSIQELEKLRGEALYAIALKKKAKQDGEAKAARERFAEFRALGHNFICRYIRKGADRLKVKETAPDGSVKEYIRLVGGRKVGVIIAYKNAQDGKIYIGCSKCNTRLDSFNKHVGLMTAIEHAIPADAVDLPRPANSFCVPHSMCEHYNTMLGRAQTYFNKRAQP